MTPEDESNAEIFAKMVDHAARCLTVACHNEGKHDAVVWAADELTRLREEADKYHYLLCTEIETAKRLREENDRYLAALRRIAGELGEFADADGETMVEKVRFLTKDRDEALRYAERLRGATSGASDIDYMISLEKEIKRVEKERDEARAALCRAREALRLGIISPQPMGEVPFNAMKAALKDPTAPCPHETKLKRMESVMVEAIEYCSCKRENITPGCCRCLTFRDVLKGEG